jgi:hypothetical protein
MKGVILPDAVYTREALKATCGFGTETIFRIDTSGIVTPFQVAHRLFYKGSEIIAWMEKNAAKGGRRTGPKSSPNGCGNGSPNSAKRAQKSAAKAVESMKAN